MGPADLDAKSPQSHLTRGRARDDATLRRCRSRHHALQPIASGRLARDFRATTSARAAGDSIAQAKYSLNEAADQLVIDRAAELANRYGVARARIALAWLLGKTPVAAAIVGANQFRYIKEAIGAFDFSLSDEDVTWLESAYVPHEVVGHGRSATV